MLGARDYNDCGYRGGLSVRQQQVRLILLVEDNAEDERLTLQALKRGEVPAAIQVARDGLEAINLLHGEGRLPKLPDLILLDIKLPKYNGLEVLQKIRQHKDTAQIPVVMLTSSDDWNDIDQSYKLGANSFIRKAMDLDQYLEEIRIAGLYWTVMNIAHHHPA
jgi:two-component system response regulator